MIISFSFSNFKSFDKKQELTFLIPKYTSRKLTQNYTKTFNQNILKSAVLFGANASEKSNL